MVREDKVTMSAKELRRVHVIRQAMEKTITQVKAGRLLGLTARQVRRLIQRVEQEGGCPGVGASGARAAVEPTDSREEENEGLEAGRGALWRFWADVGGGETGRAPRDHAQRRDPAAGVAGARDRAFQAPQAAASRVASAEDPCQRAGPARWVAS